MTNRDREATWRLALDVESFADRTGSADCRRAAGLLDALDLRGADDYLDQAEDDGYRVGGLRDRLARIRSRQS
jgi:hypothetical protein